MLFRSAAVADREGISSAYQTAMGKIREFPSCHALILNVALFLDGTIMMNTETGVPEDYTKSVEELYHRALESSDTAIQNQAQLYLETENLEAAAKLM